MLIDSAIMKYSRYPLIASDDLFMYEFYSDGPRGTIKKTVIYSQIEGNIFNLGFGDWNEQLKGLDDSNRTNNGAKADKKHLPGITVDPNMRDYSKDPFVIKKVERARALLAKYGLPEEPKKKSK